MPDEAGDQDLLAFLATVELSLEHLYAGAGAFLRTAAAVQVAHVFAAHHRAHYGALAAMLGPSAPTRPNQALLANLAPSLDVVTNEQGELAFLYAVEQQAAATGQYALGRLSGTAALELIGTILPVEAEHAVILGSLLGKAVDELVPAFQGNAGFLPNDFPTGR